MKSLVFGRFLDLLQVEALKEAGTNTLMTLASVVTGVSFNDGDIIIRKGDVFQRVYFVIEGQFLLEDTGVGLGQLVGVPSVIFGLPVCHTIISEMTRCLVLGKGHFLSLINQRPELIAPIFSLKYPEVEEGI